VIFYVLKGGGGIREHISDPRFGKNWNGKRKL